MSYTIKVEGADGHTLRVEIPWKEYDKPVYYNIDDDEIALSSASYEIESSTDTIVDWCGSYHDSFWLKPGVHKLNGTIRLFDETSGNYVTLIGARKHFFSFKSSKDAQGVKITGCYLEHNQFYNGAKGMYVRYSFDTNWMKGKEINTVVSLYKSNGSIIYGYNGNPKKVPNIRPILSTFSSTSNAWVHFPYAGMKLPKGKSNCYAIIKIYDAKSGRVLATSNKLSFSVFK